MSDTLNFRSAFHGFNREDVVRYIEYMNATHASELSQLRAELEAAQKSAAAFALLPDSSQTIQQLEQKLKEQEQTIAQLQDQLNGTNTASEDDPHTQEQWDAHIDARIQAEFDRDAAIETREQAEAERDAALEALHQVELERDALLEEKKQAVPQRDIQMEELEAYRRAERTERIARERAEKIYQQAGSALTNAATRVDETFAQIGDLTGLVTQQLEDLQSAVRESKLALADASATLSQIHPQEQ